ncbi:MAG: hypothetical protein ACKV2T_35415 [Kofleriaceae bacterium]
MPSRLSSLLVRDGLVGVKRMEKAFQRQVIYGGSLDTILLEMNLVPEERLTQYLALASGLPPASRDDGRTLDPTAIAIVDRETAERSRAVPLALDGETVRILVCSPLEIDELEDLADQLDRPLQPLIAPEYRWHLVYAAAYGLDAPARYTTLARSLDVDSTAPPVVGRAKSVIVEDRPSGGIPATPVYDEITERTSAMADATTKLPSDTRPPATRAPTPPPDTIVADVPPESVASPLRSSRRTIMGVAAQPSRPITDRMSSLGSRPPAGSQPVPVFPPTVTQRRDGAPADPLPPPIVSFSGSGPVPKAINDGGTPPSGRSGKDRPRSPATQPITTEGRESPLPIISAREMLAVAEDRDSVFLTLLRAARSRARWAGLLTVQGGAAIGRVALAEPGLDTKAVTQVLIPLDALSPFRAVVANHQPHIGPLTSGDPGIDAMALRLGGVMPPSALLMPVVLRERVVAIVVAHRVQSDLRLSDVTELLPMAHAASDAIGRLIVKHKSAGYRAPSEIVAVPIEAEQILTKKLGAPKIDDGDWSEVTQPEAPLIEEIVQLGYQLDAIEPIDLVLDRIENAREGHGEADISESVERAADTLGALNRRFPGKLRVDRFAVTGRPLRASQYGGLLELVVRLGSVSSDLLIEKMASPQRDLRFYAAICTAELRPRNAVYALAERLFDQDFGVRACAIEALAGYPVHDLSSALARVRRAVHSSDAEVVGAATAAIVALSDVEAIPDLIGAIERSDRAGDHARRALVALTAQDFGSSERKWRKWFDGARKRHRIEWLVEGLGHKEDAIRETAINDLRHLTGEYFGYHHDLPRRERDQAAEKWAGWWRDIGYRRFVHAEDERERPTALLPARKEPT